MSLMDVIDDISINRDNSVLLFQALLGSQITLFSIILSAFFVAFQLVSNRYSLSFAGNIFQSNIAKGLLILLGISILSDIFGLLFIHELNSQQAKWLVMGCAGMGFLVVVLSYPFIKRTLSRINPLYLLRQTAASLTEQEFEDKANESREDQSIDHPLRGIYLFIRSELDRGETANAIYGIGILYSVSYDMWLRISRRSNEPNSRYQGTGMIMEMFSLEEKEYTFSHTGNELFQRIVLFEPIFTEYPQRLLKKASETNPEEILSEIVSNVEMFGEKSIEIDDESMLEISTYCLHTELPDTIRRYISNDYNRWPMMEEVVCATNRLYWQSFKGIEIENDEILVGAKLEENPLPTIGELGLDDIEEIEAEYVTNTFEEDEEIELSLCLSPGADIHHSFSTKYKDSIMDLFDSLSEERLCNNIEIGRMFAAQRSAYEEYLDENSEYYSSTDLKLEEASTPDERIVSLRSEEALVKQASLSQEFNKYDDKEQFEKSYKQHTLSWPLQSFRRDLLWITEGFFTSTGFPDRIKPCGHVVGNWLRLACYAANNQPQIYNKEIVRATLVLLVTLQDRIDGRLAQLGISEWGSKNEDQPISERIQELPEKERKLASKLMNQRIGVLEAMQYISYYGSFDLLEEILEEFKDGENEYIFDEFAAQHPTTVLWLPLDDRQNTEEFLEKMDALITIVKITGETEMGRNAHEKMIIRRLNSSIEEFGKYNW